MTKAADTRPVVVGVDGSGAALAAALWAVDEAVDREAPLRLVHAIGVVRNHSIPFDFYRPEIEYGEGALRAASSAVAATGKTVKVETDKPLGFAGHRVDRGVANRRDGLCRIGRDRHGSRADCWGPQRPHWPKKPTALSSSCAADPTTSLAATPDWVVVGVDDRPGNDLVVAQRAQRGTTTPRPRPRRRDMDEHTGRRDLRRT